MLFRSNAASRELVLKIVDATLQRLDSYERIKSIMRLEGDVLHIGQRHWNLREKRNIYLFGAGKACNHMAMAVDHVLGDRLTRGIAIVKVGEASDRFNKTEVFVGGHPLPNAEGHRASQEIIRVVEQAGPEDLFIVVISGGSSALMSCPREGITLQDEIDATDVLLKSGAGIYEVNAVRRHISALNGGMLAKRIQEVGAELIGGFLRTNTERGIEENLNSQGMVFKKLCMSDLKRPDRIDETFGGESDASDDEEPVLELVYGSIARLSALATGKELARHLRPG